MKTPDNLPDYQNKEGYTEFDTLTPDQIEQSVESAHSAVLNGGVANRNETNEKVKWLYPWSSGTYEKNTMTRIGDWTTIANKQTSDYPAPILENKPSWAIIPDPSWSTQQQSGDFMYGYEFTISEMLNISGWRVWLVGDIEATYTIQLYDFNNENNPILLSSQYISGDSSSGWHEVLEDDTESQFIAMPGDKFRLIVKVRNSTNDVPYNGTWRYLNTGSTPSSGVVTVNSDSGINILIDKNEANGGDDRSSDLLLLKENDEFTMTESADLSRYTRYRLTGDAIDSGSYITLPVEIEDQNNTLRNNIDVDVFWVVSGAASDTDYVISVDGIPNYFPSGDVKGFFETDFDDSLNPNITLNDNIYGVDLYGDLYVQSPDWDIVSQSGASGGVSVVGVQSVTGNNVNNDNPQNPIVDDELTTNDRSVLDEIEQTGLSPQNTSFITKSVNLHNSKDSDIEYDTFMSSTGNKGSSTLYVLSGFIPVTEGLPYNGRSTDLNNNTTTTMRFLTYFASDKITVVAGGSDSDIQNSVTPAGAAYARATIYTTGFARFQFEQNTVGTDYIPYGYFFGVNSIDDGEITIVTKWLQELVTTFGDSNMSQGIWQPFVVGKLLFEWINGGIGGTRVSDTDNNPDSMCRTERIASLPALTKALIIMGGTNDWAQSVPLGTIDSTDVTTFYGAYNVMLNEIYIKYHAVDKDPYIFLCTIPYGELPDKVDPAPEMWPNAYTNSNGNTANDYSEAVRLIGKKRNLYVIDVSAKLGVNGNNKDRMLADDGGWIHFTQEKSGPIMGSIVAGAMMDVEPTV